MARLIAAAIAAGALGTSLGGCSDIYYDRRERIALGAGDAVAANEVAQMVDPWPAQSGNRNIAANGQKMQSAVERYRTNKVTPPGDPMMLQGTNQQQQQQTVVNNNITPPPSSAPPGASASAQ
jgi:hypothetical protein